MGKPLKANSPGGPSATKKAAPGKKSSAVKKNKGKGQAESRGRVPGVGKKKQKIGDDVYEYDEAESNVKDELRRFAGVEVYEYEQPENFEDDEEIDEDGAFNDDDFDVYGDVGRKKTKSSRYAEDEEEDEEEGQEEGDELDGIFDESGDEAGAREEDEEDDDEGEEEEDDEENHARLMSAVRSRRGEEEDDGVVHVPAAAEGEFAVGSTSGSLSLQSLVGSLQKSKTKLVKGGVSKELTKLAAKGAVPVPATGVVSARAMREAGYAEASQAVSAWQPVVRENRQKEQLSFPLNDVGRVDVTQASMVASFQPRTKFEAEINKLIAQAGADEATLQKSEELELRKLSPDDVKERQAELSRMRSLLFHAEMKARRVNKIKSKKFHKVARKFKEKAGGLGDDDLAAVDSEAHKEKMERQLRARAEERMSLKHKNTSKWVKHMLGRAYGDDSHEETRAAVVEQVKLGEQLRKKMEEAATSEEEDDEEEARQLREELEEDVRGGEQAAKVKGVLGMAFMQRSMERQREQAAKLLGDLKALEEGNDALSDEEEMEEHGALGMTKRREEEQIEDQDFEHASDEDGEQARGPSSKKQGKKGVRKASKPLPSAGMAVDEVAFSAGSTVAVSGPTSVAVAPFEATPQNKAPPSKSKVVEAAQQNAKREEAKKTERKARRRKGEEEEAREEDEVMIDVSGGKKREREQADEEAPSGLSRQTPAPEENGGEEEEEEEEGGDESNPWLMPAGKKRKGDAVVGKSGKGEKVASKDKGGRTRQAERVGELRRGGEGEGEEATLRADATINAEEAQAERTQSKKRSRRRQTDKTDNVVAPRGGGGEDEAEEQEEERRGMLAEPSRRQKQLMRAAFAEGDVQEEFEEEKRSILEAAKPKEVAATPGWGGWGGDGVAEKEQAKRTLEVSYKKTQQQKLQEAMTAHVNPEDRKDKNLSHVIINERRNRRATKFLVERAPHQFGSAEQFERSLRQPLGPDWNTSLVHNKAIQKPVVVKAGKMIDPIEPPKAHTKAGKNLNKHASLPKAPTAVKA